MGIRYTELAAFSLAFCLSSCSKPTPPPAPEQPAPPPPRPPVVQQQPTPPRQGRFIKPVEFLNAEEAITFSELSLLVRSPLPENEVLADVRRRGLVDVVKDEDSRRLAMDGASDSLLKELRDNYDLALSPTEKARYEQRMRNREYGNQAPRQRGSQPSMLPGKSVPDPEQAERDRQAALHRQNLEQIQRDRQEKQAAERFQIEQERKKEEQARAEREWRNQRNLDRQQIYRSQPNRWD